MSGRSTPIHMLISADCYCRSKSVNEDHEAEEPGKLLDGLTEKVKSFWDYLGSRTSEAVKEKMQ